MKKLALMGTFLLAVVMGCKDDDNSITDPIPLPDLKVSTTLSGANEVPANSSTATGSVNGTVNQETGILSLNIMYSDSAASDSTAADSLFTPTAWHIHKGAVDTTGAVVIDFGKTFSTPFAFKDTLSEQQLADLKAGLYYVNIHTAKYPNGEIRGQLKTEE
ncbi:CHRD domain-containing protein [Dyadobacter psychrotolerans]|uniref:CHRD domain-containing protein n=1 Tax=Dyadobacter psychrotolerans TaxID=2541721 RepID=A0A4R5DTQ1_9BACT|nr:CHRD domain-containing protein [Dyadobacter psychrotolerans]TDE14525.1 CHRD domain-containing protein [Dyadobacter psychrotolerans]